MRGTGSFGAWRPRGNPMLVSGSAILLPLILIAVFVPMVVPIDPLAIDAAAKLRPPGGRASARHR
jgi:hypothetical protein